MGKIQKPNKRTFWEVTDGVTTHKGFTDSNQVTETGFPTMIQDSDPANIYPILPSSGQLNEGEVYSYEGAMVEVRQSHQRTLFSPSETPALFSIYRANTEGAEWIENEDVILGDTRTYLGNTYKCIQSHFTLASWTPDVVPALWQLEVIATVETLVFVQPTGGHDAYQIGDTVHYPTINDPIYISLINANVWTPDAYPAGWALV